MMIQKPLNQNNRYRYFSTFVIVLLILFPLRMQSAVMSSSNYQLESSSINVGGLNATSTNYIMESTQGEIATGPSSSSNYLLKAGYQQMTGAFISVSSPANVTLLPAITDLTDSAVGSAVWTVNTDNVAGYQLDIKASASPALVSSSDSFADYTEATPGTPDVWSVGSGAAEFGYSVYGDDVSDGTWGTADDCGSTVTGLPAASAQFYDGFTTSDVTIATRSSRTTSPGNDTTVCFAAGKNSVEVESGTYSATITVTAISL